MSESNIPAEGLFAKLMEDPRAKTAEGLKELLLLSAMREEALEADNRELLRKVQAGATHGASQQQRLQAMGALAGGIAHDFNNTLGSVMGFAQLMADRATPGSEDMEDLEEIIIAAKRARDLVKQILTFSRNTNEQFEVLNIVDEVSAALKFLRQAFPRSVEIHASVRPDAGSVLGNGNQLHQVLIELCKNSWDALGDGGGVIKVGLCKVEVDRAFTARVPELLTGPYVALTVEDDGPGIPADVLPRIFDPFFTTKGAGKSSGMGLATVFGIVKSHRGVITVDARAGRGTKFTVYLPMVQPAQAAEEQSKPPKGNERLLLVDDEPSLARVTQRILQSLGYEVMLVDNGIAAGELFERNPDAFDLVLTDQAMPGLSGRELAQALYRLRPALPVVICTGFSENLGRENLGEANVRAVLLKPLEINSLAGEVRRVLDEGVCT